jgi:hypothetical protein
LTSKSKVPTAPEKSAGFPTSGSGCTFNVSGSDVTSSRRCSPPKKGSLKKRSKPRPPPRPRHHRERHLGGSDGQSAAPERRQHGREVEHLKRPVGGCSCRWSGSVSLSSREAVAADGRVLHVAHADLADHQLHPDRQPFVDVDRGARRRKLEPELVAGRIAGAAVPPASRRRR